MINRDKILWQVLAITGLNFVRQRFGLYGKFFRFFFLITFSFSFIYVTSANMQLIKHKFYKRAIAYLLFPLYSALMWYVAYCRRNKISDVLVQIYYYRKQFSSLNQRRHSCKIPFMITIIPLSPYLVCSIIQLMENFETINMSYWTFEFEVHSIMWKRIILFNGNFMYFFICICFPFYLTFSLCALFYRCSEALSGYNTVLQIQLRTRANENIEILKMFFDIVKVAQKLNHAVTGLSFLIVCYSLQGIFTVLLTISLNDIYNNRPVYRIVVMYYFLCSTVMILSYTICSSMISGKLTRIRKAARDFMNSCGYDHFVSKQNLFYLKRIESEEIVYLSACELFYLTRSFMLSAFGAILTYGLLITNLKF